MPVTVSIQEPTRFVIDATGDVTGAEARAVLDAILHDPHFGRGATILVLAHHVTAAPRSEELRDIATATIALKDGGLQGFAIVTEPGFVYGVARMFSALADLAGVPVEVFLDPVEARERLDVLSARAA